MSFVQNITYDVSDVNITTVEEDTENVRLALIYADDLPTVGNCTYIPGVPTVRVVDGVFTVESYTAVRGVPPPRGGNLSTWIEDNIWDVRYETYSDPKIVHGTTAALRCDMDAFIAFREVEIITADPSDTRLVEVFATSNMTIFEAALVFDWDGWDVPQYEVSSIAPYTEIYIPECDVDGKPRVKAWYTKGVAAGEESTVLQTTHTTHTHHHHHHVSVWVLFVLVGILLVALLY